MRKTRIIKACVQHTEEFSEKMGGCHRSLTVTQQPNHSQEETGDAQQEGCEFTAHLFLSPRFPGRCSMWDAAGACPCARSATGSFSNPHQQSPGTSSHPLHSQVVPMLPDQRCPCLGKPPLPAKRKGQQPLAQEHWGTPASEASSVCSAEPAEELLSRGSMHLLSEVNCFTQRNSGR